MTRNNTGGPAFPNAFPDEPKDNYYVVPGMTLRDYFAAKAIAVEFSSNIATAAWSADELAKKAAQAYRIADAMLKARSA